MPLVTALIFALAIVLAGWFTYQSLTERIVQRQNADLDSIASLKANMIAAWLQERRRDAGLVSTMSFLVGSVARWGKEGRPDDVTVERLHQQLGQLERLYNFRAVALVDLQGRVLLSSTKAIDPTAEERAGFSEVAASRQLSVSAMYWDRDFGATIHVLVPLEVTRGRRSDLVGLMLMRIDPENELFRLVQTWPLHTTSAETMIVRRQGDELVYLNQLRYSADVTIGKRLPLDQQGLAGALILRAGGGVVEGVDYRGVPVLAAGRNIPGTDWYMIAKIDKAEVQEPIATLAVAIVLSVLVLTTAVAATRRRHEALTAADIQ